MGILSLILCTSLGLFSLSYQRKKAISPFVFFYFFWDFILLLSVLNLYEIYLPSDKAYFYIDLMLISFFIGMILIKYLFEKKISLKCWLKHKSIYTQKKINFKIFYFLAFLSFFFLLKDGFQVLKFYKSGIPLWQIRNWSLAPFGTNNPIMSSRSFFEEFIRTVILEPFGNVMTPMACYYFLAKRNDKNSRFIFLIAIVHLILSSVVGGGGRLGFLCFCMAFFLAFQLVSSQNMVSGKLIKQYRKYIVFSVLICFIAVVANTSLRTGTGNFIKQLYTYFALPPTLLSIWLKKIGVPQYTYGLLTFFGVHSYFFRGLKAIGLGSLVPQIYEVAYQSILNAELFLDTGFGIGNAFVTPVYYFYIDGGPLAICLLSFFFGCMVAFFYNRYLSHKKIDCRLFSIYYLIMEGIFYTFMRIQTCIPVYIISFVFCYLITENDFKIMGSSKNLGEKPKKVEENLEEQSRKNSSSL